MSEKGAKTPMKTTLIALAAFVAGSLLILPLAAQTGIFDTLYVDTDAILPVNSIQEAEIDIDNAPTAGNEFFLRWDTSDGLVWSKIGFMSADWSDFSGATTTNTNCPATAGGLTDDNGRSAAIAAPSGFNYTNVFTREVAVGEYINRLSYDMTFSVASFTGITVGVQYLPASGGPNVTLASLPAGTYTAGLRVTGISSVLDAGFVNVWPRFGNFCVDISSIEIIV